MKNLKIGHKLTLGFVALIIVMTFVGGYGLWNIARVNQTHITTINYPMQRQTYLLRFEQYVQNNVWTERIVNALGIGAIQLLLVIVEMEGRKQKSYSQS
jgi:hypothetical protein